MKQVSEKRNRTKPRAPDEAVDMTEELRRDEAWYEKNDREYWSHLPDPERKIQRNMGRDQVEAWKAQQQQQMEDAVS